MFKVRGSHLIDLPYALFKSVLLITILAIPSANFLASTNEIACENYQPIFGSPGKACCSYELKSTEASQPLCSIKPEAIDPAQLSGDYLDFTYADQVYANQLMQINLRIKNEYKQFLIYARNSKLKDGSSGELVNERNKILNTAAKIQNLGWYLVSDIKLPRNFTKKNVLVKDGTKSFRITKKKRKLIILIKTDLTVANSQEYLIYAIKYPAKSAQASVAPDTGYFYIGESPSIGLHDQDGDGYCAINANSSCTGLPDDCDDQNPLTWQNLSYDYRDADNDLYFTQNKGIICSGYNLPLGYSNSAGNGFDCNDHEQTLNTTTAYYPDYDQDSYTLNVPEYLCSNSLPQGYKHLPSTIPDCNDQDDLLWQELTYYYRDIDQDSYYTINPGIICSGFNLPTGYSISNFNNYDCDEQSAERWQTLDVYADQDRDGYTTTVPETICSGASLPSNYKLFPSIINDCNDSADNLWQNLTGYADSDNDNYTTGQSVTLCSGNSLPTGFKSLKSFSDDCAPEDPEKFRLANSKIDQDQDSYGSGNIIQTCYGKVLPSGITLNISSTDCDDSNNRIWQTLFGYPDKDRDSLTTGTKISVCSGNTLPNTYQYDHTNDLDCNDNNPELTTGASCNVIGKIDSEECPYSQYQDKDIIIIDNSNLCGPCYNTYQAGITYGISAPLCTPTAIASSDFNKTFANKTIYLRNGLNGIYRLRDSLTISNPSPNFAALGNIKISAFPNENPRILYSQQVNNWLLFSESKNIYQASWLDFIKNNVDSKNSTYYLNKFKTEIESIPSEGSERTHFYYCRLTPQIVALDTLEPIVLKPINPFKQLPASTWGFTDKEKQFYKDKVDAANNIIERIDQFDLTPGTFYYEAQPSHENFGKIFIRLPEDINKSPDNLKIEVSMNNGIILQNIKNLEISNLSFNYSNASGNHQHGLNVLNGENLSFNNLDLSYNSFSPISGSCINCTIQNSKLNWGLNNGGGLIGEGTKYLNNEIAFNNYAGYFWGWHAGGLKLIANIKKMQVSNNLVHHNSGPGVWFDTMRGGHIITNNILTDNLGPGIMIEISNYNTPGGTTAFHQLEEGGDILIKNNLILNNENNPYTFNGSGIFISSSSNILAEKNIIKNSPIGVLMHGIYRDDNFVPSRKTLKNNRILHNIIIDTNFPLSYYLGNDSPLGTKVPSQYSTVNPITNQILTDKSLGVNIYDISSDFNIMYGKSIAPLFDCTPNCPADLLPGTNKPFYPYNDAWPNSMSFLAHWSQSIYSGYGWPSLKLWRAVSRLDLNSKAITIEDPNTLAGFNYFNAPAEFQGYKLEKVLRLDSTEEYINNQINSLLSRPHSDLSRYSDLEVLHQDLYNHLNSLSFN